MRKRPEDEPDDATRPLPADNEYANWMDSDLYRADDDGAAATEVIGDDAFSSDTTATQVIGDDTTRVIPEQHSGDTQATVPLGRTSRQPANDDATVPIDWSPGRSADTAATVPLGPTTETNRTAPLDPDTTRALPRSQWSDTAEANPYEPTQAHPIAAEYVGAQRDDYNAPLVEEQDDELDPFDEPARTVSPARRKFNAFMVRFGIFIFGVLLAILGAGFLGFSAARLTADQGGAQPLTGDSIGLLVAFVAGLACLSIVVVTARTSSIGAYIGSLIAVPGLLSAISPPAAEWIDSLLTSLPVSDDIALSLAAPEVAVAGATLFLIALTFSMRRRAEDLAGPVSSFFLGLFCSLFVLVGLLLAAAATQSEALETLSDQGWPPAFLTVPALLFVGLILMTIGVLGTVRAPGGMVVVAVLTLLLAIAASFVFVSGDQFFPNDVADYIATYATAGVPLVIIGAGVLLLVASFAGLSLGREDDMFAYDDGAYQGAY